MICRSDEEVAAKINQYRAEHKYALRNEIVRKCNTSIERYKRLRERGLVDELPPMANRSISATMAAKRSNWKYFRLPGSPKDMKK